MSVNSISIRSPPQLNAQVPSPRPIPSSCQVFSSEVNLRGRSGSIPLRKGNREGCLPGIQKADFPGSCTRSPSLPKPPDPTRWTGPMAEAPACLRSRNSLNGHELLGKPIKLRPYNPPKWTGAIAEAPACQRLRNHLSGQDIWRRSHQKPWHATALEPT